MVRVILVKRVNWENTGVWGAAFGPRHVAEGCTGRGTPGECGNGPSRGVGPRGGCPARAVFRRSTIFFTIMPVK